MHCDGSPHDGAAEGDGVVLETARRRKERRYPELVGPCSRGRLVVLAVEVGGRWSVETKSFLAHLAKARSRQEVPLLQRSAEQAWRMRGPFQDVLQPGLSPRLLAALLAPMVSALPS